MKKSLAFLSGICLALSSGLASAVTLNGWNVGNPTPVGATGLVNATKNVGGIAKVSNASIVPNASQVSKILRGGVAGVALTVAVNELLDGIDWVMDPANNQIRYKEYIAEDGSYYRSETVFSVVNCNGNDMPYFNSIETAISHVSSCMRAVGWGDPICEFVTSKLYVCKSPRGLPVEIRFYGTQNEIEKSLPLDTVSQKVIDKAETGNTDAQVATVAAAQDILNEAQNDAEKAKPIVLQLEANAIIAGNALYPNKISHDREDEIRQMKPNDPCDEISQAIKDLEETVKWRKSDLNPKDKGNKDYVGHQKRIRILQDKKDELNRAFKIWCEGN
ncbi:hypothetical protein ACG9X2_10815 [Acinetobacter bereziniae]|uniref:hypothetical protein n=1 Tax=Acinetobacter bereziniae TaxID=106648 RepID=UPI003AF6681C